MSAEEKIALLEAKVKELQKELESKSQPKRDKIDVMSAEVVDSNPYR
jgi:hypothetical protein